MNWLDWTVMLGTLLFIAAYGTWKTRKNKNIKSYLQGDKDMKWITIGLSVMATQASAITFISTPGQAFESGMGFVQNYFGLPLALIIVSAVFIPNPVVTLTSRLQPFGPALEVTSEARRCSFCLFWILVFKI